jgi:phosphopantetheinyl transferase
VPLHSKKQINNGIVALWEINETFDELVQLIPDHWLKNLDLHRVSVHNLAARALANEVCPDFDILEKDEYGKPFFESALHKISITHSGDFAGFMLKEGDECGIDMEKMTNRIERISSKFLREDEESFREYELKGLYMVWCAKEAMYKYYGQKALDFREHLRVYAADLKEVQGTIKGLIHKDNFSKELELQYDCFENYIIVNTI